jgi:uncharacterized protein involved in exopolysaccharide biosynthesis
MQIKTVGTVPVFCALAGAIVGGIVAMRTPEVFASSATIRITPASVANAQSAPAQDLRASLEKALVASNRAREATSVTLLGVDSARTTLRLTYLDRDAAQAQRVTEEMTAAVAARNSGEAASTEVLDSPSLPTSPIEPDYPMTVASGGGVGLVAGLVLSLFRSRRRSAIAG